MIEATTSLPFRDLLRSETFQINLDCNYPMKWNAYQVKITLFCYTDKAPKIWKKSTNLFEILKERQIRLGNFVKLFGPSENISTLKLIFIFQ